MTELILIATKGSRRPNSSIRINEKESDRIWDLVLDQWASGNGNPAIYNEELYCKNLKKHLKVKPEDLDKIAISGCTEIGVSGLANIGAIECGVLTLAYFEDMFVRHFRECSSFEEFYKIVLDFIKYHIDIATTECNLDQELKAKYNPMPIRSLLIDDCVDRGVEYQAGGARYNGSTFNIVGVTNTINSLWTLKKLAFGKKYSNEEMYNAVMDNFSGHEDVLSDIKKLPKFGNDCEELDKLAADFIGELGDWTVKKSCWRGGKYLPCHLVFSIYDDMGKCVGPTPDGRLSRQPISDSMGAYQGTDKEGPTALLKSALATPLYKFAGTPIINMRFSKKAVTDPKEREKVKALLKTYLKRGGMQLQVSVFDQKAMKDALAHPEKYPTLMVRMGGFSEYFRNLTEGVKREVIKRTEHEI